MSLISNININISNKAITIKYLNYLPPNEILKTPINLGLNANYPFLGRKTKITLFARVIILLEARFNITISSNIIETYKKYYFR